MKKKNPLPLYDAEDRAQFLFQNGAPKDWLILTQDELSVLANDLGNHRHRLREALSQIARLDSEKGDLVDGLINAKRSIEFLGGKWTTGWIQATALTLNHDKADGT